MKKFLLFVMVSFMALFTCSTSMAQEGAQKIQIASVECSLTHWSSNVIGNVIDGNPISYFETADYQSSGVTITATLP